MRLVQQIGVRIRPGITDLLQPTDTDFAMSLKASLKAAQAEEKKRMKETAASGSRLSWTNARCSLGIASGERGAEALDTAVPSQKWVPALETRHVAAEAGAEGSYRLQSRWLEHRGLFMEDKETRTAALQKLQDSQLSARLRTVTMKATAFNGEKLLETHLEIEVDELEDDVMLQTLPLMQTLDSKVQRRLKRAAMENLEDQDKCRESCWRAKPKLAKSGSC